MQAIMIEDEYIDVAPGHWYEVEKVFERDHIKLEGSPRKYLSKHFSLKHKGKKISHSEAYRLYRVQETIKSLSKKNIRKEKNAGKR